MVPAPANPGPTRRSRDRCHTRPRDRCPTSSIVFSLGPLVLDQVHCTERKGVPARRTPSPPRRSGSTSTRCSSTNRSRASSGHCSWSGSRAASSIDSDQATCSWSSSSGRRSPPCRRVAQLKANNWTFFGVPTAQINAAITVTGAVAIITARHARPLGVGPLDAPGDTVPSDPEVPDPNIVL